MDHARTVVTAEKQGQKMQLHRLVNREPRERHHEPENYHRGVREPLEAVIEINRWRRLADSEVVEELRERARHIAGRTEHAPTPFAAGEEIREVKDAVKNEEP